MRLVTPIERVLIALGPSRNIALLDLDEPVSSAAALAQVMAWVDAWPRFGMVFREYGPWYRAQQTPVDPLRHVVAVDAGDASRETLLVATLTGTLDPDIPPWQVVLVNPADGEGNGPCRVVAHFDHAIADGVRFVNLLSAARQYERRADEFAALAERLPRLSLDAFLRAPRDPRVSVPDVAVLTTEVHGDRTDNDADATRPTRRLTRAITRAVAEVVKDRRLNRRCAAVTMIGRRQASEANAITAIEVESAAADDPPQRQLPVSALIGMLARQRWYMQAGQNLASVFPARLVRWLTARMATRWDGILTLVPFGRRPLSFAGRRIAETLVPHGPDRAGAADAHRSRLSQPFPPDRGDGGHLARQGESLRRRPRRGTERSGPAFLEPRPLAGCAPVPPVPNTRRPATMAAANLDLVS